MTAVCGLAPHRSVLDNGAVLLVKQARTMPAVSINASFRAGTVCDPPDRPGLSHFLSRVIDRGSSRRSGEELAEELDARGVTLNVGVSRHLFTLSCSCLRDDLAAVLDVIAEVSIEPALPADEVDIRRGEVLTAIRQDEDSPAAMAVEGFLQLLYGDHPYGQPVKGAAALVEEISRADLVRFHQQWFGPSALSLFIVGDVDAAEATAHAAAAFGRWTHPSAPPPGLPAVEAPRQRRRLVLPMMNKAQADIAYGFPSVTRRDSGYHAVTVMNNILGQYGLGGRLGESIRERQGMAYYVFSTCDPNVGPGPLMIRAGVSAGNVDRAVASIDHEVRRLAVDGVREDELNDARQYLIGSMPRMLETNHGIAAFLQTVEFHGLGLDYDLRLPGLLRAVTADEVAAAARRLLDPERAALVIAGPYTDRPLTAAGAA